MWEALKGFWNVLQNIIEIKVEDLGFYEGAAIVLLLLIAIFLYYKRKEDKSTSLSHPEEENNKNHDILESEQILSPNGKEVGEQHSRDTFKDCDDCPEMVIVPAGEFWMGATDGEEKRQFNEDPRHKVTISKPFAVGKYHVTRGQFKVFVDATGYDAGSGEDSWLNPGFTQTDIHPVIWVSWNDVKAYVSWLSQETGQEYRLLSEAEWEYVARAGTTTAYHFGDRIFPNQANYLNKNEGTIEVGSYPANAFGLHDVHGNVWEWVEDCYHKDYNGAPTDGSAWVSDCDEDEEDSRVLRGGSWEDFSKHLCSALRGWNSEDIRYSSNGFRVARTLTP